MELWFYHLEHKPLDQVLPDLLEKSLVKNWKVLISSPDGKRLTWLDQWLWTWRDDSFLPHDSFAAPRAEKQPILLTTGTTNENQADVAVLLDGADPVDFQEYQRLILLFDGADEQGVQQARVFWKSAVAKQQTVRYWKQNGSGVWKNLA